MIALKILYRIVCFIIMKYDDMNLSQNILRGSKVRQGYVIDNKNMRVTVHIYYGSK